MGVMSKSCESCAVKKTTRVKRMAVRVTTAESWRVVRIVSQSVAKLQKFRRGTHREIASLVIDCSITFSGSCVTLPWLMSPLSLSLSPFSFALPHTYSYQCLSFFSIWKLDTQMRPVENGADRNAFRPGLSM